VHRFRGGLVFKAHRLCASLNSRLKSNKEEEEVAVNDPGARDGRLARGLREFRRFRTFRYFFLPAIRFGVQIQTFLSVFAPTPHCSERRANVVGAGHIKVPSFRLQKGLTGRQAESDRNYRYRGTSLIRKRHPPRTIIEPWA